MLRQMGQVKIGGSQVKMGEEHVNKGELPSGSLGEQVSRKRPMAAGDRSILKG